MESFKEMVQDIVESAGYKVTEKDQGAIVARKKRALKLFVVEDWSFENFEAGLKKLVEMKEDDSDYCVIVEPSAE
ncbi:MAG: hypothetical protein HYY20_08105, partial [Candidatus Tectomicrobia bacterium]|nr:hypothetical protein [Candidatus Tectomicrobia bacterium]